MEMKSLRNASNDLLGFGRVFLPSEILVVMEEPFPSILKISLLSMKILSEK